MVTSPQVSWLFFKARANRPYLIHTGRASKAEKQPTGRGPEGCLENGPTAALLVGYVSIKICALLAPCRRPILNATTSPLYARRYTRLLCKNYLFWHAVSLLDFVLIEEKHAELWLAQRVFVGLRAWRRTAGGTASLPWARRPGLLGVCSAIYRCSTAGFGPGYEATEVPSSDRYRFC